MDQGKNEMKTPKKDVLGLSLAELTEEIKSLGMPGFIAKQVYEWVFKKYRSEFSDMPNISKMNRDKLAAHFVINRFLSTQAISSGDGYAKKYIFELSDHAKIESVVLREKTYNTLCISSQCGCAVDCKFCLTGVAGLKRQLAPSEIVNQILYAFQDNEPISHLVFMGMGEPLLNFEAVFKAIEIINSEEGFNIGKRKITVSTSGILRGLQKLLDHEICINLALSIGNAIPSKRIGLMPIEKTNPLTDVINMVAEYQKTHNRKLTLEYTLIEGRNDAPEDIKELINLAKYLKAKINLINLNPHPKIPLKPISNEKMDAIKSTILAERVPVTIRFRKGQDISAACGQLGESLLTPC